MKEKHIRIRVEQCVALSKASNCPRRKFGALLIDPLRNVVLMDGYNGAPRGGGELCGGHLCLRDSEGIASGTRVEIGCHHAEMNVICNAAANGVRCQGAWLFVTGEPCLMCAKLIHHAGIIKVLVVSGGYAGANGIEYLQTHNIGVELVVDDELRDPRTDSAMIAFLRYRDGITARCDSCGKPSTKTFLVVLANKIDGDDIVAPFVCSVDCGANLGPEWLNDEPRSDRVELEVGNGRRMLAEQLERHWGVTVIKDKSKGTDS